MGDAPPPQTFMGKVFTTLYGEMNPSDLLRVFWFAGTLFFIIGYERVCRKPPHP